MRRGDMRREGMRGDDMRREGMREDDMRRDDMRREGKGCLHSAVGQGSITIIHNAE